MATNDLQLFDFNSHNIRVMEIDGDPWFIASDVAKVLGYRKPGLAVQDHCKGAAKHSILTKGGRQSATIIPERDVYRLIMRSKLPSAEAFEEWVVGTVLPAIRKDGGYVRGEENVETEEDIMEMSLRTMDMLRKKLDEKTQQLDVVSDMVTETQHTIHKLSRQIEGVNTMKVKQDLMREGFLYKRAGRSEYRVYSQYKHLFKERTKRLSNRTVSEIYPTEKGLQKLAELKDKGKLTLLKKYQKA